MMNPRMEIADVARLYQEAEQDHELVEIELDTSQLRAISAEEAEAIMSAADLEPQSHDFHSLSYNPKVSDSLEALLRLSWPVWKGRPDKAVQ
jgi:hypothetical protein